MKATNSYKECDDCNLFDRCPCGCDYGICRSTASQWYGEFVHGKSRACDRGKLRWGTEGD